MRRKVGKTGTRSIAWEEIIATNQAHRHACMRHAYMRLMAWRSEAAILTCRGSSPWLADGFLPMLPLESVPALVCILIGDRDTDDSGDVLAELRPVSEAAELIEVRKLLAETFERRSVRWRMPAAGIYGATRGENYTQFLK